MEKLYIYAYPAQLIILQLLNGDKIINNENCKFNDTVLKVNSYLKNRDIDSITIIGQTSYADRIEQLIYSNFNGVVNIERIKND